MFSPTCISLVISAICECAGAVGSCYQEAPLFYICRSGFNDLTFKLLHVVKAINLSMQIHGLQCTGSDSMSSSLHVSHMKPAGVQILLSNRRVSQLRSKAECLKLAHLGDPDIGAMQIEQTVLTWCTEFATSCHYTCIYQYTKLM